VRRVLTATALAAVCVLLMAPSPWAQAAVAPSVAPHIHTAASTVSFSGFSPKRGPMGIKVFITGTGFLGTTGVAFHGTSATFKVISNTRISTIVPCGTSSGHLSIHTPKGTVRSVGSFKMT
jgi:hypothetical protein